MLKAYPMLTILLTRWTTSNIQVDRRSDPLKAQSGLPMWTTHVQLFTQPKWSWIMLKLWKCKTSYRSELCFNRNGQLQIMSRMYSTSAIELHCCPIFRLVSVYRYIDPYCCLLLTHSVSVCTFSYGANPKRPNSRAL